MSFLFGRSQLNERSRLADCTGETGVAVDVGLGFGSVAVPGVFVGGIVGVIVGLSVGTGVTVARLSVGDGRGVGYIGTSTLLLM